MRFDMPLIVQDRSQASGPDKESIIPKHEQAAHDASTQGAHVMPLP